MKIARVLRWVGMIGCFLALMVLLGLVWVWNRTEASLPELDGEFTSPGLAAPAQLARDAQGTVSITAASREDAAQALGFAHAQDRFFQMDLARRRAAGELSQLFGDDALFLDRATIGHRFRPLARQAIARLPENQRAELAAYTRGVNAGLASLPKPPWEYAILRAEPREWTAEDCGLVFYAMVLELQDAHGEYERTLDTLRDVLGDRAVDFFNPVIGPHDRALDGSTHPLGPPPTTLAIDLREGLRMPEPELTWDHTEQPVIGSNALALTGSATAHGAALVAGDPHLGMQIPNTWYRAALEWPGAQGTPHRVSGVSLPGVPGIIIGSNGHIAWTFTNATVDVGDLVPIDLNQAAPELLYHQGTESLPFDEHVDRILLKDGSTEEVLSTWTIHGPIVARTKRGKSLAYRWVFHDPIALNFDLLDLMTTHDVESALAVAATSGMPNQNLLIADQAGNTAWTLTGKLPRRFGFDGRFPVSWTFGDRGWEGYLSADERPVVRGSAQQPLWSGNQRKVSGDDLQRIGDAGYDDFTRADQLARGLTAIAGHATPADLLAIQLDDRGDWLLRWRDLLTGTLRDLGVERDQGPRGQLLAIVEDWQGRATVDSVGYRILREWHDALTRATLTPIFAKCVRRDPSFRYQRLRYEEALWTLHQDGPTHLLAAEFVSWSDLRVHAVDVVLEAIAKSDHEITAYTWGEANRLAMRHPFARFLPDSLAQVLNMPASPQAGDSRLPRVARPSHGASLRFAVAPGHEETGIMHLPAGQSGNPLSPFYRAGHDAWLNGEATPFLPGETQHLIVLKP